MEQSALRKGKWTDLKVTVHKLKKYRVNLSAHIPICEIANAWSTLLKLCKHKCANLSECMNHLLVKIQRCFCYSHTNTIAVLPMTVANNLSRNAQNV